MELLSGFDDVTSQRQYVIIGKEFLLTSTIHRNDKCLWILWAYAVYRNP